MLPSSFWPQLILYCFPGTIWSKKDILAHVRVIRAHCKRYHCRCVIPAWRVRAQPHPSILNHRHSFSVLNAEPIAWSSSPGAPHYDQGRVYNAGPLKTEFGQVQTSMDTGHWNLKINQAEQASRTSFLKGRTRSYTGCGMTSKGLRGAIRNSHIARNVNECCGLLCWRDSEWSTRRIVSP